MVLIAKEWLSFGHQFQKRVGHGTPSGDDQQSPCFIQVGARLCVGERTRPARAPDLPFTFSLRAHLQFLDTVWQLVVQYPRVFEFSPRMLLVVADHVSSCRFGTFLFNCERERVEEKLAEETPSLWGHIRATSESLLNPFYDPTVRG